MSRPKKKPLADPIPPQNKTPEPAPVVGPPTPAQVFESPNQKVQQASFVKRIAKPENVLTSSQLQSNPNLAAEIGARSAPHLFAHFMSSGKWQMAKHVKYIGQRIALGMAEANAKGRGLRMIVNLPPRYGKTELISKWLPTWYLDNWPHLKVMMCSYGSNLAVDSGRTVRDEFENNPILRTKLREDIRAVGEWKTKEGGGMKCEGIGGGITGFGYNLGIIDDVLKDAADAYSPVMRNAGWEWFKSTFYYRKEPGAHIIVLGHRWHSDDLFGRLMKLHQDPWEIIKFPALAKPGDILGRKEGEPLWPERWSLQEVMDTRKADPIWFDAMHQQEPPNEQGDRVYDHYTAEKNLLNASDPPRYYDPNPTLPLCFTLDFNRNPGMHALISQQYPNEDVLVILQEVFVSRGGTEETLVDLGKWLDIHGAPKGTFPWPCMWVYGDRSGTSPTTVTSRTDYDIIKNWLEARDIPNRIFVPFKNPSIKDRVDTVNAALSDDAGKPHIKINALNCPKLERDLSSQPKDENGQPDKSDQTLGHAADALGYECMWLRPIRKMKFEAQRIVGG